MEEFPVREITEVNMKKSMRLLAVLATAAIGVTSVAFFAGCDTDTPEVTITYEFNGTAYEVEYVLSRKGSPQTVQHFIELADAGYYNGTVIHDYQSGGVFLYGGAYTLNGDELEEKDYWTELRNYEKEHGFTFTQTVFAKGKDIAGYLAEEGAYVSGGETYTAESEKVPLYTLHGEFSGNGVTTNSKTYRHNQKGILAMAYTGKGTDNTTVRTVRSDGGANNNNQAEQDGDHYSTNCATSIFYTFTGESRTDLDATNTAFGVTKDYEQLQELLDAIVDYTANLEDTDGDGNVFTSTQSFLANRYDPIDSVRNAKISTEYNVPVQPITIKTVKVTKY